MFGSKIVKIWGLRILCFAVFSANAVFVLLLSRNFSTDRIPWLILLYFALSLFSACGIVETKGKSLVIRKVLHYSSCTPCVLFFLSLFWFPTTDGYPIEALGVGIIRIVLVIVFLLPYCMSCFGIKLRFSSVALIFIMPTVTVVGLLAFTFYFDRHVHYKKNLESRLHGSYTSQCCVAGLCQMDGGARFK